MIAMLTPPGLPGSSRPVLSVLLALGFTSTLLHYYFDGFIWKLRQQQNRDNLEVPSDALARGRFTNEPGASRCNVGERRSIPATLLRQALYFGVPLTIVSVGAFAALNGPGMNYVGYMLRGHLRMHTPDGEQTYSAGEAFYWAAGHAPEAITDCDYIDFSPTKKLKPVLDHITGGD